MLLEPSEGMYSVAKRTVSGTKVELYPLTIEAYNAGESFDLVLSHMCGQTVGEIHRFFESIRMHVHEGGELVIALPHPAFYNDYKRFFPANDFRYMKPRAAHVNFSITLAPDQVIENVPYYHRPLSTYVNTLVDSGFLISRIDEIYPSTEIQELYVEEWQVPRYLVLRAKPA